MFIRFENITDEITIDVRTVSEFNNMRLFQYNIPIINEADHIKIKSFYPLAIPIILVSLYRNKNYIKKRLMTLSNNGAYPIVIGCSRGRLRSPIVFLYAKFIGVKKCKILFGGIKIFFLNKEKKR
ncbi:hypothetical protein [Clostridium sardiniense]|uniref:hypothetical protein n=1 Tax=Clostridium sardiniense TaxID=29369 RepID=UPI003D3302FF